jgi:hypothetical protein
MTFAIIATPCVRATAFRALTSTLLFALVDICENMFKFHISAAGWFCPSMSTNSISTQNDNDAYHYKYELHRLQIQLDTRISISNPAFSPNETSRYSGPMAFLIIL